MAEGISREPEADCPVCWSPYNNTFRTPKLLDCGHCFCLECLARLSLVSQPCSRLQCPLCRQPTVLQPKQPITDLPTNSAVLAQLRLEPNQIMLEGRQLCFKDSRTSRFFTRQPTVYTLTLGMEQGGQPEMSPNQVHPHPATIPSHSSLCHCFRNPQFRIFLYLMATMLSVTLLLIFSIFWTRRFLWGMG
ncbi:E3 ubiquitin-protein ligase RNF183 [Rhinatrema bivittatum]|uniref:E3 ubiquitin-protein ligase RNF183 n=1 Tax=Rhinatrema bivittatum TaxID=194408 RepID=UPI001126B3FB|nr:E3 ubiquitin-protein ligase RNF183 [Rhinatrema bivittatum]XP_029469466.1 E3 ubiquitin-protein ligase RNF183 [Rhinatrema bivittatum]